MEATLLKNAFVYRIEKGEYEVMDVYISGGRIYTSFEGKAREIDLKGKYLMPGFFDCHVHLTWSGAEFFFALTEIFLYLFISTFID